MTLIYLLALFACVLGQTHEDIVVGLIPEYNHSWYSGYLNVSSGKALHYVFFESQHDHNNDPIIVWLGSSLGYSSLNAMAYENGPFRFRLNSTQHEINNQSWNREANLLYIESLPSSGFSIGSGTNSDESIAKDNLLALIDFLAKFPRLRNNRLFLSGSGYAGTFAAHLAQAIYDHNQHQSTLIRINLRGLLLGNPCIHHAECVDVGVDSISYKGLEFLYKHGYYTEEQWNEIKSACSWDFTSTACYDVRTRMEKSFKDTNSSLTHIYHHCFYEKDHYGDLRCQDTKGADTFLNGDDTKLKLHVLEAKKQWKIYNHEGAYKFQRNENGSYTILQNLMKHYQIWIYSGDVSATVPLKGTLSWLNELRDQIHLPVMEPWREWWTQGVHPHEDQVAGMVWKVRNITLVTVRAGGFDAARNRPHALQEVVESFLNHRDLPRKGQ